MSSPNIRALPKPASIPSNVNESPASKNMESNMIDLLKKNLFVAREIPFGSNFLLFPAFVSFEKIPFIIFSVFREFSFINLQI